MTTRPVAAAAGLPVHVASPSALATAMAAVRAKGGTVGLVPTMGALHAGHVSLVEASRRQCDCTVVSIFVNPLQFAPSDDFARYPRTLEADLAKLAGKADIVYHPTVEQMYSPGNTTTVQPGALALPLEGEFRPGHFRGVATVVLKLLNQVRPDRAFFGQKDYQQLLVVRQMVRDLDVPVEIHACPIVREADGLALSSRNAYLSPAERLRALALSRSLQQARELVDRGERRASTIEARMQETLLEAEAVIDYAVLAEPDTLARIETIAGPTIALIAARIGATRLIDNALLSEAPA